MVLVFVEDPGDELCRQALTFARSTGEEVRAIAVDGTGSPYAPAAWAQAIAALVGESGPSAVVAAGTDRGNEVLAQVLNTIHNLSFYLDTMRRVRHAI